MDGKGIPTAEQLNALLSKLYEEYFDYLVDYAQSNGFSPDVAADLVQDTYTVALQKAVDLYNATSQRAWLIVTLRNLAGNHQKNIMYAQKLQQILAANYSDQSPADLPPSVLYKNMIDAEDLDILIRYWVNGDTAKMIAADLGLKEEACKKRIQRAKARFKKAYEEQIGRLE